MTRKLLLAVLWLPSLAAAGPGYVSRATDLREAPYPDAKVSQPLAASTAVEIKSRQGGWYQVQIGQFQGWVRMAMLRLRAPSASAGLLDGGRSVATQTVVTTGVRGLDDRDLQGAAPDLSAADGMDTYAANSAEARSFAAQAGLQAKAAATGKGGSP